MSPENAECLLTTGIDCCVLGNNHVLDWERMGLLDTLVTLERVGIKSAGAGRNLLEANAPAVLQIEGKGRVIVFSFAAMTSGVPRNWAATHAVAGVNLLPDFGEVTVGRIADQVAHVKQMGDVIIASIHWGANWSYEIAEEQRSFAHSRIDRAHVSAVHGHSSHHPKAIEIYKNQLILYGCGDFLNDYKGIRGYEEFRGDLTLMYFADFNSLNGHLIDLELVPLQMRRFELVSASGADILWLARTLDRGSGWLGAQIKLKPDGRLTASSPESAC